MDPYCTCILYWGCVSSNIYIHLNFQMQIHINPNGSIRIHMDPHGSIWIHMEPFRSIWSIWIRKDPYGFALVAPMLAPSLYPLPSREHLPIQGKVKKSKNSLLNAYWILMNPFGSIWVHTKPYVYISKYKCRSK